MEPRQLSRETIEQILEAPNIEELTFEQIATFFLDNPAIAKFAPDGICQVTDQGAVQIKFSFLHKLHDEIGENRLAQ